MAKKEIKANTLLMPVPVTLVTALDENGRPNIITLAWVGTVASVPPQISISIRKSRYSHKPVKDNREFVLNIPGENLLVETDACGSVSGRDVHKFEEFNLTPTEASVVKAPLIEECPINMECKISDILELGSHDMFVAEIVAMHANEEVLSDGRVNASKMRPIAYCPHDYWSLKEKIGTYGFSQKS